MINWELGHNLNHYIIREFREIIKMMFIKIPIIALYSKTN